jgi:hypothetical protein
VSRFAQDAQNILEAAASAARRGEACAPMTILIGAEGAIRICMAGDWPLDSLLQHHGARAGYRVSSAQGIVRVEGRQGSQSCLLETRTPAHAARWLLGQ